MTVTRYDLNRCIGCMNCFTVCPMDVFRFDKDANKSVIAYPENCQNCGQCYVNCKGYSLVLSMETYGYANMNARQPSKLPKRMELMTPVADEADETWDFSYGAGEEAEAAVAAG